MSTSGDETKMPALRLAVLIDADNTQASIMENLFQEIAGLGEVTVRRVYGDFTFPEMSSWKDILQQLAIKPTQQYVYMAEEKAGGGKVLVKTTDGELMLDAMELLHTKQLDGFCLVSSKTDFTRLALRIREAGKKVYGFGGENTPVAFRTACHKFTFTEILRSKANDEPSPAGKQTAAAVEFPGETVPAPEGRDGVFPSDGVEFPGETVPAPAFAKPKRSAQASAKPKQRLPADLVHLLKKAVSQTAGDDGWTVSGAVSNYLLKIKPDFDARSYGYKNFLELMRSVPDLFTIDEYRRLAQATDMAAARQKSLKNSRSCPG